MNSFEAHGIAHLSPSSLNLWLAAPSLWVLEKLLGHRGGMGCAAHRGTAVELGVSAGLFDHALDAEACIALAMPHYDKLTALNGDNKRDDERAVIPGMIRQGLALRSHGLPIMPNGESRFGGGVQHKVEIRLDDVPIPVIGYLDWLYAEEVLDLKSTLRIPSIMSPPHLRQASVYKTAHMGRRVRFHYVSEKKAETHTLTREQYDVSMKELTGAAQRLGRFLALSNDKHELAAVVPHTTETFYFSDPTTRAVATQRFGY